jgi:hypothetical protein
MRVKSFGLVKRFSCDFREANKRMEIFTLRYLNDRWKGNLITTAFVHEQDFSASVVLRKKDWKVNELFDRKDMIRR